MHRIHHRFHRANSALWGTAQQISFFLIVITFQFGLEIFFPSDVSAADPAARHKQLANAIANEVQLRNETHGPTLPYVHWIHLDRDSFVDAIVILKRDEASCAFSSKCLGLVLQGTRDGFKVISSFAPNHHPLHFAPRSKSTQLRSLYYTDNGESFDEIVFHEGRYQLKRRGLSLGQVRDTAPWFITETLFDDLDAQIAAVKKSDFTPMGAPILVNVSKPPDSLWNVEGEKREVIRGGYRAAQNLESNFQRFFSHVAANHLLSHTVHVDFVACWDLVTRVPLANQQDRSSSHVVGCLELLGVLEKNKVSSQDQFQTLLYLLTGSFGQALAIQDNLLVRVTNWIEDDRSADPEVRKALNLQVRLGPELIFYLYGHLVVEKNTSLELPGSSKWFLFLIHEEREDHRDIGNQRKEFEVLWKDMSLRFQCALCARVIRKSEDDMLEVFTKAIEGTEKSLKISQEELFTKYAEVPVVFGWDKKKKKLFWSPLCILYGKILEGLSL